MKIWAENNENNGGGITNNEDNVVGKKIIYGHEMGVEEMAKIVMGKMNNGRNVNK